MKNSKMFMTLLMLALALAMLLPASLVGASSAYNVALNKPVYLDGSFFTGGWGGGLTVDEQTITDGVFLPRGQQWDQGAVWWDSTTAGGQCIFIDLDGVYEISSFIVQADDNDAYRLFYRDLATNSWQLAWDVPSAPDYGMQTRPNPLDDTEEYVLPSPIVTNYLKLMGDDDDPYTDHLYAVSEIQAYGYAVPNYVTGGGTWDKPGVGKKVDFSFAGCVGTNEIDEIVGQFQITNHMTKTSYHSTGFTYIEFWGSDATTPRAINKISEFTGTFRNNKDDFIITLTIYIWENAEEGEGNKGTDAICIQEGVVRGGGSCWIGQQTAPNAIYLEHVSSGNFQRHNI